MRTRYSLPLGASLGALSTLPAHAAGELNLKLELPEISTGMYERPYVAVWIEKADDTFVQTLSLWHMQKNKRGEPMPNGDRYLPDMRSWWKSSGSTSQMPIDGISSATRAPGQYELTFAQGKAPLNTLAPGKYQLVLEVAREVKGPRPPGMNGPGPGGPGGPEGRGERDEGGPRPNFDPANMPPRGMGGASKDAEEELRVEFEWPAKKVTTVNATGKAELGKVALTIKP